MPSNMPTVTGHNAGTNMSECSARHLRTAQRIVSQTNTSPADLPAKGVQRSEVPRNVKRNGHLTHDSEEIERGARNHRTSNLSQFSKVIKPRVKEKKGRKSLEAIAMGCGSQRGLCLVQT